MAKVQILPEKMMPDPLDGAVPSSHRRFCVADMVDVDDDEASVRTDRVCFIVAYLNYLKCFKRVIMDC